MSIRQIARALFLTSPGTTARATAPDAQRDVVPSLTEMLSQLSQLSEAQWALYAFSREPLRQKFDVQTRIFLAKESADAGVNLAKPIRQEGLSPESYAKRLGLLVERLGRPSDGSRVLFAQYFPSGKVRIYEDCLDKLETTLASLPLSAPTRKEVASVLLAHELFHALEEKYATSIFTRSKRVLLWKIGRWKYTSPISCLSEIGAMAFARELCNLAYSPYLLDVLLVYGYNPAAAANLYRGILRVAANVEAPATITGKE